MSTQELKTFILKESGDFDKFDISATLKLTDEEINKEIQKIRKRRKLSIFGIIFLLCIVGLNLISMKTGFMKGWLPNWPLVFQIIFYFIWVFYDIGTQKKKEYIYQLLLKADKLEEPVLVNG